MPMTKEMTTWLWTPINDPTHVIGVLGILPINFNLEIFHCVHESYISTEINSHENILEKNIQSHIIKK